ncbi:MAG: SRPBCC family protein [Actinomycetota bacterium]
MRFQLDADLPVPPEDLWPRLLVWEDQARWLKDATWVRVRSAHREGIGTRIDVKTLLFGVPAFAEPMEVIGWEPPRRLVMRHGKFVKGTGEWLLERPPGGGDGLSRFTWTEDISLNVPVIGGLAVRIYARFMRHLMRGSLENLRRFLAEGAVE